MLWRNNKGKDQPDDKTANKLIVEEEAEQEAPMSREEFFAQSEEARKVFNDIMSLRKSVESLKQTEDKVSEQPSQQEQPLYLEESEEILAAKQVILQQAEKDVYEEKARREEALRREEESRLEQQRVLEAQKRAAKIEEEAERKRQRAIEADRKAKEVSRRIALEQMEAERLAKAEAERKAERKRAAEAEKRRKEASPEEMEAFFGKKPAAEKQVKELENAKNELLSAQKEQSVMLGAISQDTETNTGRLAEEQQLRLSQQQKLLREEQAKLELLLEQQRTTRLQNIERSLAEKELRLQKAKVEKLMREQKAQAAREEKLVKAQRRKEEKIRRTEERDRLRRERREAADRIRQEKRRLEEKSRADAALGGGIVNVKGLEINTEIKDVASFSWRDFLGIKDKEEKKAKSAAQKRALQEEREKRTEEARAFVDMSLKQRAKEYEKSKFGKKVNALKAFCDRRKVALLTSFAIVLMAVVGAAGVFNYYTAYTYSYNDQELGIVKEKDDVLRITDLVQSALTEEKEVDVVIDARKDISFNRVIVKGDVKIDTSEDVLKRLTYLGDLNVKAYGIYVNGKKVGAVESEKTAAAVLQQIKDQYTSHMEGAKIEEAVIIEEVAVRESNTDLQDISTKDEMVDILCTSGEKETVHKIKTGETLADIAKLYSMTEKEILEDNQGVDQKKLTVGSTLVIKQHAPVLTVRITEKVTYEKEVAYQVQETDSKDIYEGYTELQQKGENGLNEVTSRIVLVNGEQIEEEPLVTTVKKEPVTEIVLVGIKERPPTVGSGKYIWPLAQSYTITSRYGMRWGRLHEGVDLALPTGGDVVAADGGTVTYAGYNGSYGYLIKIDHQNGMETRYAHNSKLLVSEGDKVFQGQHIAESGNTGRSTGPHLHFEIRVNGNSKDPLTFLP